MRTELVHSLTSRRREREMGDSAPGASWAAVMCCHVCAGGPCNMARQLRTRLVPDAPDPLPPPPPRSRRQRKTRERSGARGDDSAVLPLVHNVEQTDAAMSDADPLVFPSTEDEDQMTASFFRSNFFESIVTGYTTTSGVSQRLRESMHLTVDTAGVMWTADNCMCVPDANDLRTECFDYRTLFKACPDNA